MTVSTHPVPAALNTGRADIPTAKVLCVALTAAAFWWQLHLGVNPDTTWLTLMAERWLAGERLFIDLHENNPPASIYLYVPAVLAGKVLGIRSELALQILTIATFAGALYAAYRMFVRAGYANRFRLEWVAVAAIAIFFAVAGVKFCATGAFRNNPYPAGNRARCHS